MIEINLLPEELKPKPKKPGIDLESKETLYFIPLVFGVLIAIHILLGIFFVFKNVQLGLLNHNWKRLEAQRRALEAFRSESAQLSEDARALQQITSRRLRWAVKLNKLSLDLTAGIWFRAITADTKTLDIRASVIALQKTEMVLINKMMDALKQDKDFYADFDRLELGSIERKTIGGYDIAEFSLTAALKER
jgi:Tfp pilus assembly protein PilN